MDENIVVTLDNWLPDCLLQVSERRQERTALGQSTTYLCHDSRTAAQAKIFVYEQGNRREAIAMLTLQKKLCDEIGRNKLRFDFAYDGGLLDGGFWLLHRLETKQTLIEWWEQDQSVYDRTAVFLEVAVGLSILHKAKVYHGRMCPDCIYVDTSGESVRCVIGDTLSVRNKWGLSITGESNRSYLRYALPDTVKPADFDEAADNYALGMIVSILLALKSNLLPNDHAILADYSVKLIDIHTSGKNGIREFIQILLKMLGGKPFQEEDLAYGTYWSSEFDTKILPLQSHTNKPSITPRESTSYRSMAIEDPSNPTKPLSYMISVVALITICVIPIMCRSNKPVSNKQPASIRKNTRRILPNPETNMSQRPIISPGLPTNTQRVQPRMPPVMVRDIPSQQPQPQPPQYQRQPIPTSPHTIGLPGIKLNKPTVFDEDKTSGSNAIMDR